MAYISRTRAKEILQLYKSGKHDLFNWCEEYKEYVYSSIHGCMSYEVEYMLKRSYEDNDGPLSYEDIDLFDCDMAKDILSYNYITEVNKYHNDEEGQENTIEDTKKYINDLDKKGLIDLLNAVNIDQSEAEAEVLEWWVISDPMLYRFEKQGEILLKGACVTFWGRQTSGQNITLDGACMKAFISHLEDMTKED